MKSLLRVIENQKVENINILFESELYIYMEKYTLAIYTEFIIDSDIINLIGTKISSVEETEHIIYIIFDKNIKITIYINNDGLENIVLTDTIKNIAIVW